VHGQRRQFQLQLSRRRRAASGLLWGGPLAIALCSPCARAEAAVPRECTGAHAWDAQKRAPEAPGAASTPDIVRAPRFALVKGAGALAEDACAPARVRNAALLQTVTHIQAALGVDAELAIVLSSAPLSCSSLFYVPVANDVRGIGYAHERGADAFDDSPDSALEGIVFLNDWPYWQDRPEEFERAFAHEVGHRWGARVRAQIDGEPSNLLLGRDLMHWSYFLDSAGSPLEGNTWVASAGGEYRSDTQRVSPFSALDLYAMGVLPANDVPPFTLLRAPNAGERDCRGNALSAISPPQLCAPVAITAEQQPVTIEDIIAVEGERQPAAQAARDVSALVIVLETADAPLGPETCAALTSALDTRFDDFEQATGGRITLYNRSQFDGECVDWTTPAAPDANGCSVSAARPSRGPDRLLTLLGASLLSTIRRRARAPRRSSAPSHPARAAR
jgi:hypothetical protein